jgi:hypothetical protein
VHDKRFDGDCLTQLTRQELSQITTSLLRVPFSGSALYCTSSGWQRERERETILRSATDSCDGLLCDMAVILYSPTMQPAKVNQHQPFGDVHIASLGKQCATNAEEAAFVNPAPGIASYSISEVEDKTYSMYRCR